MLKKVLMMPTPGADTAASTAPMFDIGEAGTRRTAWSTRHLLHRFHDHYVFDAEHQGGIGKGAAPPGIDNAECPT
jgi:hypothetical protein